MRNEILKARSTKFRRPFTLSTLNESALNLSAEKDSKILELEETLDNSVQEYETQLNAMQTVFKKKLAGYRQFLLPYELD